MTAKNPISIAEGQSGCAEARQCPLEWAPAVGELIAGRYRVESLLGQGGMGRVLKARDERVERSVAIKVMTNNQDPEALRRALLEAKAAARIRSDHVVHIYDAGQTSSGYPYVVMESLEGADLAEVTAAGAVPIASAVHWILQAAEAVAHLGSHGIVHRDIKPANLFLEHRADGARRVKLLDFGIAKCSTTTTSNRITKTGQMLGSVPYMAPEQVDGNSSIDPRADVWSLGVVLYEMLTGRPPFEGSSTYSLMKQIKEREHTPACVINPRVPEKLSSVVDRCLAKNADDRWQHVADLASALSPFAPIEGAWLVRSVCAICDRASIESSPLAEASGPARTLRRSEAEGGRAHISAGTARRPRWLGLVGLGSAAVGAAVALGVSAASQSLLGGASRVGFNANSQVRTEATPTSPGELKGSIELEEPPASAATPPRTSRSQPPPLAAPPSGGGVNVRGKPDRASPEPPLARPISQAGRRASETAAAGSADVDARARKVRRKAPQAPRPPSPLRETADGTDAVTPLRNKPEGWRAY